MNAHLVPYVQAALDRVRAAGYRNILRDRAIPDDLIDAIEAANLLLSPRQDLCLRGLCEGKTVGELARDLSIENGTVHVFLQEAQKKLCAETRYQACAIYAGTWALAIAYGDVDPIGAS